MPKLNATVIHAIETYKRIRIEIELTRIDIRFYEDKKQYLSIISDKTKNIQNEFELKNTLVYYDKLKTTYKKYINIIQSKFYNRLPDFQKLVFKYYVIDEMTPEEIQKKITGVTIGAVLFAIREIEHLLEK